MLVSLAHDELGENWSHIFCTLLFVALVSSQIEFSSNDSSVVLI